MMKVYHLTDKAREEVGTMSWIKEDHSTVDDFSKNFDLVAYIDDIDDVEKAFFLTNTIENYWWDNENVTKGEKDGYRSTSVGDVVKLSDGTFYMVGGSGWDEVFPTNKPVSVTDIIKDAAKKIEEINA